MFAGSTAALAAGAFFSALLAIACVSDLRTRRISNKLNLVLAVTGVVFSVAVFPLGTALAHAALGMLVGLAIWIPCWLLRFLGAGDVTLAAAAGAWLGVGGVLRASFLALLIGGALALLVLLWQRKLRDGLTGVAIWASMAQGGRLGAPEPLVRTSYQLPYGVALAMGAALTAWFPALLG